jgi:hypothetical protein
MKRLNTRALSRTGSILVLLSCLWGSNGVYAAGYSGLATINNIQIFNGGFYVQLDKSVAANPDACPKFNGWYIFLDQSLDSTQNSFKEYTAATLSAFTLQKRVNIYVTGCYNGYPQGQGLTVSK